MSDNTPFIHKLFLLVGNEDQRIQWSKDGKFFIIPTPEDFAANVLPDQFYHSNFASFVRQLNMYGFRKVADLNQIAITGSSRAWAFEHPQFLRDQPQLLDSIHRKPRPPKKEKSLASPSPAPSSSSYGTPSPYPPQQPNAEAQKKTKFLVEELNNTKKQQVQLQSELSRIQKEQRVLWEEHAATQRKIFEQQQVTNQIISFLASVINQPTSGSPSLPMPFNHSSTSSIKEIEGVPVFEEEEYEEEASSPFSSLSPSSPISSFPSGSEMDLDAEPSSQGFFQHRSNPLSPSCLKDETHDPLLNFSSDESSSSSSSSAPAPFSSSSSSSSHSSSYSNLEADPFALLQPQPPALPSSSMSASGEFSSLFDDLITPYCSTDDELARLGFNGSLEWVSS